MFDGADVVGGDVEERCGVEVEAVDAVDFVRLRRDLHHQVLHAVRDRFAHHADRVERFRGGQVGLVVVLAVEAVVDRREQRRLAARDGVEDGVRQVGGRGLAFRAGDADERELVLRIVVEGLGEQAQRLARVVDNQSGGLRVVTVIVLGHVGGHAQLVGVLEVFGFEPALAAHDRTVDDVLGAVGDRGELLAGALHGDRIHRPLVRGDDLPEQMVLVQQCCGRLQCQRHAMISLDFRSVCILTRGNEVPGGAPRSP